MRVADFIIDYIYKQGTDTIFTLAGGGAMFLNDAVIIHKKMKYICNHHEQASGMAAEAYAKTKEGIGAVMVTSGPGSTNAITGLLEAWQNSIPVIFISSQAKKSQMTHFSKLPLRQFGVQELDIIPIIKSITKYASYVEKPKDIVFHLKKAYIKMLSDRPGPVWLDIPPDVASAQIDNTKLIKISKDKLKIKLTEITETQLDRVTDCLKNSRKPLIIAGGGIKLAKAKDEFRNLIKLLAVPVVVPDMGLDILDFENPSFIGKGGTKGDRAANIVIQNSDLIISIGSRLAVPFTGHEYDKFAPKAKKIVIDVDLEEHKKKTVKIDLLIKSDAKLFIKKLSNKLNAIGFKPKSNWLKKCQKIKNKYAFFLPKEGNTDNTVNMYLAVEAISKFSKPGDYMITDAGITAYISTQNFKFKKNQRAIIPGGTLTMGYNLPAIIGVWAADKKANIICITGDGSLQMNIHELATIVHNKIPAKIFITNNSGYLAIRTTQKNFFQGRLIGEGIKSGVFIPDVEKIAKAYGIKSFRIRNQKELDRIIPQVMRYKGTVICDIYCPTWQDILTISSKKAADGKMTSLPIDDMFPFLPDDEMNKIREELS